MSVQVYRANLSASSFPFLAKNGGRTVIVGGQDNNYVPTITSSADTDKDRGLPQIYYGHNILPTQEGFQSVGYTGVVTAGNITGYFDEIYALGTVKSLYIAINRLNNSVYLLLEDFTYKLIGVYPAGKDLTTATIGGTTYVCLRDGFMAKVNEATLSLDSVTLSGIDMNTLIGICESSGYLVTYSKTAIAWSSTIDPLDFVPSLSTGAGGGSIEEAKGDIVLVVSNYVGLVIYTTNNIVVSTFSGNSRYPFNFKEIPAGGGLESKFLITYDSKLGDHYVYTTKGLQLVNARGAQSIFPAVTDFLGGKEVEDFDINSMTFSYSSTGGKLLKRLAFVSNRYLCLSYGITKLTHILVYDTALKRWGKLKITHTSVVELTRPGVDQAISSLGILKQSGEIEAVDMSYTSAGSDSVIILGKFQFVRSRLLNITKVELENTTESTSCHVQSYLVSKLGKFDPLYKASHSDLVSNFLSRATGINHSLAIVGAFSLNSVILHFSTGSRL